jgi:hypothetical protein
MHALIDNQSILIADNETTVFVAGTDPAYGPVRRYLLDERGEDIGVVRAIVESIRTTVKSAVAEAVSVVDGTDDDERQAEEPAYRIAHGDPVEETVLATAIRITREDGDMAPLGAFLRRLERNPSAASRSQLFGWLKAGGFTLTTDGYIVGYKSVRSDGLSAHSGIEPVTVLHQDGTSETVTGRVPYPVGATVWMPRDLVDDNRHSPCAAGIHVGTFGYARDFSDDMLVVLVDPADVVSVPAHSHDQKMRVCRLYVAARHDGEQIADAVVEMIRTIPDFDAVEDYARRAENQPRPTYGVASFGDFDPDDDEEYGENDCDDDDYADSDDEGADRPAEHDDTDEDTEAALGWLWLLSDEDI